MDINALNIRVTFQKAGTIIDKNRNHKEVWEDYYTCWATCVTSHLKSNEDFAAAVIQERDLMDVTVRWSSEIARINSKEYRIQINERYYNILTIDEMGFLHNSRKFHCELMNDKKVSADGGD